MGPIARNSSKSRSAVQVTLQPQRLCRANSAGFRRAGRLPSAGGPSLRTYVLAHHSHPGPNQRRSPRLRPGPRIHPARGRSRAPRPRPGAYAAPRIHSICGGPTGRREPAGTHQTQGTPRPRESGRSSARRVPGHRRGLRVGRVWRSLRRRAARLVLGRRGKRPGPSPSGGATWATGLPSAGCAGADTTSLHLTRGSTPSLPAGSDRARRTWLRAGRLGHRPPAEVRPLCGADRRRLARRSASRHRQEPVGSSGDA